MGWGTGDHEGYADEKWPDGRWSGPTHRSGDPDAIAYQAVCSCGWRSERQHPLPPRPTDLPRDERGLPYGPAYDTWIAAREQAEDACHDDWDTEHFQALLGYEPHEILVLARDRGGQRHFLDGRPVHAGATLELLLGDGHWLPIRYEWSWSLDASPTAHAGLGGPDRAVRRDVTPAVSFDLPPRAILRWPIVAHER